MTPVKAGQQNLIRLLASTNTSLFIVLFDAVEAYGWHGLTNCKPRAMA